MKIFLNIIVLNFVILSLSAQSNSDSLIYWKKNQKLGFGDFQGKKPNDHGHDKARSSLVLVPSFINKDKLLNVKVICAFNKYESWMIDTSKALLNHEQLHFDITELFARKIRKGVFSLIKSNQTNNEMYTKLIKDLFDEYNTCNIRYDEETAHSTNRQKQKEWEHKIACELEDLKDYEDY